MSAALTASRPGPSPRVRGSPSSVWEPHENSRSIPARAGEPPSTHWSGTVPRVHPRACGGASRSAIISSNCAVHPRACGGAPRGHGYSPDSSGPSPRVRGSPSRYPFVSTRRGSIPARAGEPFRVKRKALSNAVHPRACGGAEGRGERDRLPHGPSPRVRGSRIIQTTEGLTHGSIPARAGEPNTRDNSAGAYEVHPRACGGAMYVDGQR